MRNTLFAALMISGVSAAAFAQSSEWPASATSASAPAAATAQQPAPLPRARDGEVIDSQGGDAIPALPLTVMSNGTMKYVTGGVGDEELAQLKSLEGDFNVQMLIATKSGEFVGNTTVRVVDNKDTVLFTVDKAGPYFYAGLPAGDYMFEITTARGKMQSVKVKAPASGTTKPVVRFDIN